ncbi:MAG: SH3 domain-containing protein [Cyanobacteria bacterium P01_D01_bin.56]
MMKRIYGAGVLVCGALVLAALPAQAQACPYRYTSEYGYDILTGEPETRTVLRPDYGNCNRQTPSAGASRRSVSPTYTVSNPSRLSSNVAFPVTEGMPAMVATENGGVLNVRSGAGLDSPVIGTLANQTEVSLPGETEGGWVQINEGGWVHSDYLKPM